MYLKDWKKGDIDFGLRPMKENAKIESFTFLNFSIEQESKSKELLIIVPIFNIIRFIQNIPIGKKSCNINLNITLITNAVIR